MTFTSNLVGWLVNSPSDRSSLGYHRVYVRAPTVLPQVKELLLTSKIITPIPSLLLVLIYQFLIPPTHHPARSRNPLRLCAQCIDRPAGHPTLYGGLQSLDVYSDGVDPCGVHHILYRWILPLSACPTFRCHPRDLSRRPMVERRQDLEHLPGHHPTLSSIE